MVKQTKLGFDKVPGQEEEVDLPMVDIRGNLLRDQKGDLLYNREKQVPSSFTNPRNSTPAIINNEATPQLKNYFGSLPVEEQFPVISEVSTSLLGIPRGNQQQSLLADVSVYGLDRNTWEYSQLQSGVDPAQWETMASRTYGPRYGTRLVEYPNQYALALEAFPVNWNFAGGPAFDSLNNYNAPTFERFLRFIQLGNFLYKYFVEQGEFEFAETHFVPEASISVEGEIFFENAASADVKYDLDNSFETFRYLEGWTVAWMDIRDLKLQNPLTGALIDPSFINNFIVANGEEYTFDDTIPGYGPFITYYSQLQSKEAFRYQPGAISGFTFGVKLNQDPTSTAVKLEWGAVNPTDHYVFQVTGSQFNIVRRSVVPLSIESLNLMGLGAEDQQLVDPPNPYERPDSPLSTSELGIGAAPQQLYETVIKSDNFNGDPLNGTGRSGYNISFNEVTMYKIEFSWYGAIGAKFYAYIPVGNGEARWVLIHTLLIENLLEFPSLKNPYMYFRYSMSIEDTTSLREPVYIYKYGASMYIDGEDDGTYQFNNYTAKTNRPITYRNSTPIMGFLGKDAIDNSDGIAVNNQKNFYFDKVSMYSDVNSRVDILSCECCPGGHGHFYAPSLVNTRSTTPARFRITTTSKLEYVNAGTFSPADDGKKIIAEGVYCAYVKTNSQNETDPTIDAIDIKRRTGDFGNNEYNTLISDNGYTSNTLITVDGVVRSAYNYEFDGKLCGFDDVVASPTPITKKYFDVQFLNPQETHNTGDHFAEFRIGVSNRKPEVDPITGELTFGGLPLNQDECLSADWVPYYPQNDITGAEIAEIDPRFGQTFETDPRILQLPGQDTGFCSNFSFILDELEFVEPQTATSLNTIEEGLISGNFLLFLEDPGIDFLDSEIGIWDGIEWIGSGIFIQQNRPTRFTRVDDESVAYYVRLSAPLDLSLSIKDGLQIIAFKVLKGQARQVRKTRAYSFSDDRFYVWIAMHDDATVNNITIKQYDDISSSAFTPQWIFPGDSPIQLRNVVEPDDRFDEEGLFAMGGASSTNQTPANFVSKNRLDSVEVDTDISLPLRPAVLKSSIYLGAGKTEIIDTNYLFGIDRFKITPGTFNNSAIYLSSVVLDEFTNGVVNINVNGKEQ